MYTNVARLTPTVDRADTIRDSYTGEVIVDSSEPFVAIQRRLGNVSMIAWLAEEIAKALAGIPESAILTKVLYNATHSGDVIVALDFPQLLKEIGIVRHSYRGRPSTDLEEFLGGLEELIAVAREQENPIVFV